MSFIYKISCKDLNVKQCYFGSTIDFNKRKWSHKSVCNNENGKYYNYPLYQFIRENNGWDNFKMQVIDFITSEDKEIYQKCEAKYIRDNIDIVLNKQIPDRKKEEWNEDNKEKIIEYCQNNKEKRSEYYQNNKEKINEYKKQKVPCDICNKILTKGTLSRHKKNNKKCLSLSQQ
jgi:hypothetical protein